MTLKKKKNKKFYGIHTQAPPNLSKRVYLVYKLNDSTQKAVSDRPYDTFAEAKEAMEGYLAKGLCSWIVTYND